MDYPLVGYSIFEFSHFDPCISRSWCVYSVPGKRHCFLLYVIKQRSRILVLSWERTLLWFHAIQSFVMFLAVYADPTWKFGAYSKRRYSEGVIPIKFEFFFSFLYCGFLYFFIISSYHDMNSSDLGWCSKTPSPSTYSS